MSKLLKLPKSIWYYHIFSKLTNDEFDKILEYGDKNNNDNNNEIFTLKREIINYLIFNQFKIATDLQINDQLFTAMDKNHHQICELMVKYLEKSDRLENFNLSLISETVLLTKLENYYNLASVII